MILKLKNTNFTNILPAFFIIVSNKVSSGKNEFKYFVGYKDTKKIRPLCKFLPKMSAYRRDFDKIKCAFSR